MKRSFRYTLHAFGLTAIMLALNAWSLPESVPSGNTARSARPTSEAMVAIIRAEVQNIEKSASKFSRIAIPWEGRSTEGGELAGFFQAQTLRKAVEDVFGEMGRATTELYFQSNRLIFAVSTTVHYKRPFYFDDSAKSLEISSRVQERCWFAQDRLVSAAGHAGKLMPIDSPHVIAIARKFKETAAEALTALSKAKPRTLEDASTKHPIDAKVDALLAGNKGTSDDTFGARMATRLWDDELNRLYGELRSKLDAADAKVLQDAQRKWIVWRDAEFDVTDRLFAGQPGTMFQPMCEQHKLVIVRSRAGDLQHWLDLRNNYLEHRREMETLENTLK